MAMGVRFPRKVERIGCIFAGPEIGSTGVKIEWSLPVVLRNWNKTIVAKASKFASIVSVKTVSSANLFAEAEAAIA
jgi:hypothetical protein